MESNTSTLSFVDMTYSVYRTTELYNATMTSVSNQTNTEQFMEVANILVSFAWSLIIFFGVIGNGLVIYILFRYGERSVTNVYVINLAFADLMFIVIVVPVTLIHIVIPSWILGDVICKFSTYMIYVTLHATCLTLSAMTIDRYHAIVNPIQSMNWRSTKASSFVSLGVWAGVTSGTENVYSSGAPDPTPVLKRVRVVRALLLYVVSLSISLPYILYYKVLKSPSSNLDCGPQWPDQEKWSKATSLGVVLTTFILPLTAIMFCYGCILNHLWKGHKLKRSDRSENEHNALQVKNSKQQRQMERKKRVTRMVAIVVLLFAVCWCPIHFFVLWFNFDPHFPRTDAMHYFKLFANTLSYANSCVNPFVYAFVNDGFRKAILKRSPLLSKLCKCVIRPKTRKEETSMIDKAVEAKPELDRQSDFTTTQTSCVL